MDGRTVARWLMCHASGLTACQHRWPAWDYVHFSSCCCAWKCPLNTSKHHRISVLLPKKNIKNKPTSTNPLKKSNKQHQVPQYHTGSQAVDSMDLGPAEAPTVPAHGGDLREAVLKLVGRVNDVVTICQNKWKHLCVYLCIYIYLYRYL